MIKPQYEHNYNCLSITSGDLSLLTREEEIELSRKIKNGDISARNKLVEYNIRLIPSMLGKFKFPDYISREDAKISAEDSLISAATGFDPEKWGTKFSTYACRAIFRGFQRLLMKTARKSSKEKNIGDENLEYLAGDYHPHYSLDRKSLREKLNRRMRAILSERERKVIEWRYLSENPLTLEEAGKIEDVCKERIRQIEFRALRKLKGALEENEKKELLSMLS